MWQNTIGGLGFQYMPRSWGYPMIPVVCWHPSSLFAGHCLKFTFNFNFFLSMFNILCGVNGPKLVAVYVPWLGLSHCTSFMLAPPLVCLHCLNFDFYFLLQKFYVQRYVAKTWVFKVTEIGFSICPVPGAIQWYRLYAGTPSSLLARHCLKFNFNLKKVYVQRYVAKYLGVKGSKLVAGYAPWLGLSNGASFMLAPPPPPPP